MHNHHVGHVREHGDRGEILLQVVAQPRVHAHRNRVVHRAHQQRVAVGRRLGRHLGAQRAASASPVVDDERLTHARRQHLGEWPCERIGSAAGWERYDQPYRFGGIALRLDRKGCNKRDGARDAREQLAFFQGGLLDQ